MEIEKMVNDTRSFTKRVQELIGPQVHGDAITLVADLTRTIGILSDSVLTIEKKRLPRTVRLGHDIADVLYMLIAISDAYHIDLERVWNEWSQQMRARLDDGEFIEMMRNRLSLARANRQ
jgi:DNA-binding XRE family transcriptional regulator